MKWLVQGHMEFIVRNMIKRTLHHYYSQPSMVFPINCIKFGDDQRDFGEIDFTAILLHNFKFILGVVFILYHYFHCYYVFCFVFSHVFDHYFCTALFSLIHCTFAIL